MIRDLVQEEPFARTISIVRQPSRGGHNESLFTHHETPLYHECITKHRYPAHFHHPSALPPDDQRMIHPLVIRWKCGSNKNFDASFNFSTTIWRCSSQQFLDDNLDELLATISRRQSGAGAPRNSFSTTRMEVLLATVSRRQSVAGAPRNSFSTTIWRCSSHSESILVHD